MIERRKPDDGRCETCGRAQPLTFHLIPRKNHRKPRFKKAHTRAELLHTGLYLCRECHRGIHDLIPSERELGVSYNTKDALLAHEGFARHLGWVKKQR